jgi:hypothetical protein
MSVSHFSLGVAAWKFRLMMFLGVASRMIAQELRGDAQAFF